MKNSQNNKTESSLLKKLSSFFKNKNNHNITKPTPYEQQNIFVETQQEQNTESTDNIATNEDLFDFSYSTDLLSKNNDAISVSSTSSSFKVSQALNISSIKAIEEENLSTSNSYSSAYSIERTDETATETHAISLPSLDQKEKKLAKMMLAGFFDAPATSPRDQKDHTQKIIKIKQEDVEQILTLIKFPRNPIPPKPAPLTIRKSSKNKSASPIHTRDYLSGHFDKVLPALKNILVLTYRENRLGVLLCALIARDIYSLLQDVNAPNTEIANEILDSARKTKIIELAKIIYDAFIKPDCPFPLNISSDINKILTHDWPAILFPKNEVQVFLLSKKENQEAINIKSQEKIAAVLSGIRIPPIEPLLDGLGEVFASTGFKQQLDELVHKEIDMANAMADNLLCLREDDKQEMKELFFKLSLHGCPKECTSLAMEIQEAFGINNPYKLSL